MEESQFPIVRYNRVQALSDPVEVQVLSSALAGSTLGPVAAADAACGGPREVHAARMMRAADRRRAEGDEKSEHGRESHRGGLSHPLLQASSTSASGYSTRQTRR
jgi:hypothetical protein